MDNIILIVKKYSIPAILLSIGVALLIFGLKKEQSTEFMAASILVLVGALISFLHIHGKIKKNVYWAFGFLSLGLASYAFINSYILVSNEQENEANYEESKLKSIQNLKDVMTIQKDFFSINNRYAGSWNEIENFADTAFIYEADNAGSVPRRRITLDELKYLASIEFTITKNGEPLVYKKTQAIDNHMSEEEAIALLNMDPKPTDLKDFKRNKKKVKLIETNFTNNISYIKNRKKNNLGEFDLYALRYIPMASDKTEWKIKLNKKGQIAIEGNLPYSPVLNGPEEKMFIKNFKRNKKTNLIETIELYGSWEDK